MANLPMSPVTGVIDEKAVFVDFGKYEGKSIREVSDLDPGFYGKLVNERETGIVMHCGYANSKKLFPYGLLGVAHRRVTATELNPRSNNCNTFSVGLGIQMNFKYLSPFVESRFIKQDYNSHFIGLVHPGLWHPLVTAGISFHAAQDIEKIVKKFKQHDTW